MASQTFTYVVTAEVQRTEGKFASRDEISEMIVDNIQDPGSFSVMDSEYEVLSFDVQERDPDAALRRVVKENKDLLKRLERIRNRCLKGTNDTKIVEHVLEIATLKQESE